MTAQKPPSTALVRILALSLAGGSLAACDYASKLPDAPATLGYEIESKKPPSVTSPDLLYPEPPQTPPGAAVEAARPPAGDAKQIAIAPLTPPVPAPVANVPDYRPAAQAPTPRLGEVASAPPSFVATGEPRIGTVGSPPNETFEYAETNAPSIGDGPQPGGVFQTYEPVAFDAAPRNGDYISVDSALGGSEGGSYEVANAPVEYVPDSTSPAYAPAPDYINPPLATPSPLESGSPIYRGEGSFDTTSLSPVAVLTSRLSNGAVVNVHPVIGAPVMVSQSLARIIATELGSPATTGAGAAAFDLRATAQPGDPARGEWQLFDSSGKLVGTFLETQAGGGWGSLDPSAVNAVGRRVADRLRRNDALRRSTLTSLASVQGEFVSSPTPRRAQTAMIGKAPASAPVPLRHPRRVTRTLAPAPAPVRVASLEPLAQPMRIVPRRRPAAVPQRDFQQMALQNEPMRIQSEPLRARPAPIKVESLSEPIYAPLPAPSPEPVVTPYVAPAPAQPQPVQTISAPEPSFDTLRPVQEQQIASLSPASGPSPVVFRGVRGAPGDGDNSLSREVSRLLSQSGANMAQEGTPNALFLTAQVSTQRTGSSDRIKIVWQVQDGSGARVGQVVQENDVPVGALDGNWGQDAFYAAQGARDGILQLLKEAGALGA